MYYLIIFWFFSCVSPYQQVSICDNYYDVFKHTEYDYEIEDYVTIHTLLFPKTKLVAFSYEVNSEISSDRNMVKTSLYYVGDTLTVKTSFYNSRDTLHTSISKYLCIPNGLVRLSDVYPDSRHFLTKKTARKDGRRLFKRPR